MTAEALEQSNPERDDHTPAEQAKTEPHYDSDSGIERVSIFDLEGSTHWLRLRKVDNDLLAHRFHDSAPYVYIQANSMPPSPLKEKHDKRW